MSAARLAVVVAAIVLGLVLLRSERLERGWSSLAPASPAAATSAGEEVELESPGSERRTGAAAHEAPATEPGAAPAAVTSTAGALDDPPPPAADEVRVRLVGEDPAGAEALLVRGVGHFMGELDESAIVAALRSAPLRPLAAERGEARFTGLAAGQWSAGVRTVDGQELWRHVLLGGDTGAVLEFERGLTSIGGTVWDAAGRPVLGASISVDCPGPDGGARRARAVTDARGTYRISGLRPGAGWFAAAGPGGEELASHVLSLPPGGDLTIDIGAPGGTCLLRATFVNRAGETLGGGAAEGHPDVGLGTVHAELGPDGVAELALSPGAWNIRLWGPDGDHGMLGRVTLDASPETERTFEVPGARIGGRLVTAGGGELPRLGTRQEVALRTEPRGRIVRSAPVAADGAFRIDGVVPGAYFLTTWPREEAVPVQVTVTAGDVTVDADVTLR